MILQDSKIFFTTKFTKKSQSSQKQTFVPREFVCFVKIFVHLAVK